MCVRGERNGGPAIMDITLYVDTIEEYLKYDNVIDYDNEAAPVLIYHGLNGVYLSDYGKWIRLDARGNKEGVNAQFSVETEQLAYAVRPEMGEEDGTLEGPANGTCVLRIDTKSGLHQGQRRKENQTWTTAKWQ